MKYYDIKNTCSYVCYFQNYISLNHSFTYFYHSFTLTRFYTEWKVIFFIYFCGEERNGFHKGIQCFPISPQYDYISVDRYIWRCNFAKYQSVEIIAYVGPFYGVFKASRKRFSFWKLQERGEFSKTLYIYIHNLQT